MSKEEVEQVAGIFRNLGADQQQASTMASQLVKRAEQLSDEKKTSKIKELQDLLETAICGAQGILKPTEKGDSGTK
jgi:F0F1-type ATP synthase membrane subunit b/b'